MFLVTYLEVFAIVGVAAVMLGGFLHCCCFGVSATTDSPPHETKFLCRPKGSFTGCTECWLDSRQGR